MLCIQNCCEKVKAQSSFLWYVCFPILSTVLSYNSNKAWLLLGAYKMQHTLGIPIVQWSIVPKKLRNSRWNSRKELEIYFLSFILSGYFNTSWEFKSNLSFNHFVSWSLGTLRPLYRFYSLTYYLYWLPQRKKLLSQISFGITLFFGRDYSKNRNLEKSTEINCRIYLLLIFLPLVTMLCHNRSTNLSILLYQCIK